MPLAIRHISYQALRLAEFPANEFYNVNISLLIVSAHIVDLTHAAFVQNKVNSLAMILHIQPITDIQALAIHRQRLVSQGICNHERYQFLWEMIRSIVI